MSRRAARLGELFTDRLRHFHLRDRSGQAAALANAVQVDWGTAPFSEIVGKALKKSFMRESDRTAEQIIAIFAPLEKKVGEIMKQPVDDDRIEHSIHLTNIVGPVSINSTKVTQSQIVVESGNTGGLRALLIEHGVGENLADLEIEQLARLSSATPQVKRTGAGAAARRVLKKAMESGGQIVSSLTVNLLTRWFLEFLGLTDTGSIPPHH
jgi:hypothetical protein